MYALVKWQESARALRHSRRGTHSRTDLWERVKGSKSQDAYKSLPTVSTWSSEIRLLHLHPGKKEEPIRCTLETVSLELAPEYEALSYAWSRGETPEEQTVSTVYLNGAEFRVLPNLYTALQHLRCPEGTARALWIDYVCINQSDTKERNAQVQKMGEIYKRASRVVCWLGEANEETPVALELLDELGNQELHLEDSLAGMDMDLRHRKSLALDRFFHRPWFTRVWTMQEVALAKDSIIVCGDLTRPWDAIRLGNLRFSEHWRCCELTMQATPALVEVAQSINMAANRRWDVPEGYLQRSMCDIIGLTALKRCTDPRDFIYGVFGMLNPKIRSLKVDYDLPTTAVFRRAAVEMMRHEEKINYLIAMFSGKERLQVVTDLPSYVADFSHIVPNYPLQRAAAVHNACGQYYSPKFHVIDERTVSYEGHIVDTVATVCESASRTGLDFDVADARILINHLKHVEQVVNSNASSILLDPSLHYETSEAEDSFSPQLCALYRTLTFGVVSTGSYGVSRVDASCVPVWRAARRELVTFAESPPGTSPMTFFSNMMEANALSWALDYTIFVSSRRFFITKGGFIGIGPEQTEVGDNVVVLKGSSVPFIVRPSGEHRGWTTKYPVYTFQGPAYVEGIMNGEAVRDLKDADWKAKMDMRHIEAAKDGDAWTEIHLV